MITNLTKVKYFVYILIVLLFCFYPGKNKLFHLLINKNSLFKTDIASSYKNELIPILVNNNQNINDEITAESFLIVDVNSFTKILSKNAYQRMAPASTVKIATALIAYKQYKLDQILTTKTVIEEPSRMGLIAGERMSTLGLLYGTLLGSANDAAYTLAENYPGGTSKFISEMNSLAKRLKLRQTNFVNPIGFDHPNQYTTAFDLALLSREFVKYKILTNITSTKNIVLSDADYLYSHTLNNLNELLGEIPHLGGLKTGTTEQAGQNLISFYEYKNKPILIIVLKSLDRFNDTRKLIEIINNNLEYRQIL